MLHKITIKGNNSDHISRLPKVYVEFFNLAPLKSRFCGPKALKLEHVNGQCTRENFH